MDTSEAECGGNRVPTVAIVGVLNVDLILEQVNQLPGLENERIAEGMTCTMGSSSANLAANAGVLGLSVGFLDHIGDDTFED